MSTPQYTSPSLVKLLVIIKEFEHVKLLRKDILEYYGQLVTTKIKTLPITAGLVEQIYDMLYVFEKYEKCGGEVIQLVVKYKILEIRALVLDLICDDYYSEVTDERTANSDKEHRSTFITSTILRVPDSWIVDIVNDLRDTYDLENLHPISQQLLHVFIRAFFDDCRDAFIGQRRFKSMGNQLVLNLAYFCERMGKYMIIDRSVLDVFYEHIEEGQRVHKEEIFRFLNEKCNYMLQ